MFIVALLMIPKGRFRAWSTILSVMAVMTGGTQLVEGSHFVASQANRVRAPKQMNFRQSSKGRWGKSFSIKKISVAVLRPLYRDFSDVFWEKNLQHDFPEMRRQESKAFWKFSEIPSVLVPWPVLKSLTPPSPNPPGCSIVSSGYAQFGLRRELQFKRNNINYLL